MSEAADESDYTGPVTLQLDGGTVDVEADLRGNFAPVDGRYHWYGRLRPSEALDELVGGKRATGTLETPTGSAPVTVSDRDLWGRYRVEGNGQPPYYLPKTLEEVEAQDREASE
ncbi:DUF4873 domain-containing protein [Antrihabitans sp. YC2-6]|uniref:DUF4873 domain-containing protein n=1 Tax=Antrihabitans sp. YC2-6 TaxID=2799498 RepID=UPI0018F2B223|nr:DUF4873 domain-containing protein [Antrihabitans sp. YC2-6]MBJ8347826.1 DUF4873 domain-containing protein [Antrihabitans sp. YC2-6]